MKIKRASPFVGLTAFALLLLPAAFGAEEQPAERGSVEFGVRYVWGDVYGRPDLRLGSSLTGNPVTQAGCVGCGTAFDPGLKTSKYNEYRDLRNGFFIRRFNATFDNLLGSKNYVNLQSQKTLYRDQSYLATFGQYGRFRVQFRYDEIPHVYTDTARTLYTEISPGAWSFPASLRQTLQATSAANLPSVIAGTNNQPGVVPFFNFLTPSIIRKAGTALVSYNVTPDLNISGSFWREAQNGLRPIGLILNSSPSASATAGYGVELPETISYFNNLVRVGAEYGKRNWAVQAAYIGSFFHNSIGQMVFDNPFNFSLVGAATPQRGQMDLYPSNHAHYLYGAGAADLGNWVRVMASVNPGWLRQNDAFLPYTTNTALNTTPTPNPCSDGAGGFQPCTLPPQATPSLNGSKQTLALNTTLVTLPWKKFQIKAAYRHYDYNNNTRSLHVSPTEGDVGTATPDDTKPFAYNRKTVQVTGNYYFADRSSAKVGYEGEWMDRSHRDVEHSMEHSIFAAVDTNYWKNLTVRLSYRHSSRKPDEYQDEAASDPVTGALIACTDTTTVSFTEEQRCHRRFDEAHRVRNRADGLAIYNFTDKFSVSAFGGGIQDDYNQAGGTNSPTPLNFLTGAAATTHPYYLYGILKDISYNYGAGGDYAVSPQLTLFAEYSHEHYYRRMVSRNRTPPSGVQTILTCAGCDSANNDWESTTPELVDIWTAGVDTYFTKKVYFTTYYSLSAARSNTFSRFLGDPTILAPATANRFVLVGASAAGNYPESVNRQHEVVAVFKYKLSKSLWPKFEFRYQQFDNKDFQTSPMTQYMGCMSPAGAPGTIAGCPVAVLNSTTSPNPVLSPNGQPSPFYPYFQVGDNSAARYLFLGADQPSYKAYYVSATLEYHF